MRKTSDQDFIKKANIIHNEIYSYEKMSYISNKDKIVITCKEHGDFMQSPSKHLSGRGCPICANTKRWDTRGRITIDSFTKKANIVHGGIYVYPKQDIKGNDTNIDINCNIHGIFSQKVSSHLSGSGCPVCANNTRKSNERFIKDAKEVHGDVYDYTNVDYNSSFSKVEIICNIHGSFHQTPSNHINGKQGCPFCGSSGTYNHTYFKNNEEEKTKKAILYLVKLQSEYEVFLKIGITKKNIKKRFPKAKRAVYSIDKIIEKEMSLYDAWKIEQNILSKFKNFKYISSKVFPGHTELISNSAYDNIIEEINNT